MIGAICGDVVGSVFEFDNIKTTEFEFFSEKSVFTDDTVLTVATMDVLMNGGSYAEGYRKWFRRYPDASFGQRFYQWGVGDSLEPYNSWGNGSAMRVSPIGLWHNDMESTRAEAKASAAATHNHPDGIKGAEATAAAVFLARTGSDKETIKSYITSEFGYTLTESVDSIRTWYSYDISCQGTVPPAVICFLESTDFEDSIRNAISIGGDSDTIACITGGIAEAFYGIPADIKEQTMARLPSDMRSIVEQFYSCIEENRFIMSNPKNYNYLLESKAEIDAGKVIKKELKELEDLATK